MQPRELDSTEVVQLEPAGHGPVIRRDDPLRPTGSARRRGRSHRRSPFPTAGRASSRFVGPGSDAIPTLRRDASPDRTLDAVPAFPSGALQHTPRSAFVNLTPIALALGDAGSPAGAVGIVLTEAIALYVGYGALTRHLGPTARGLIGGDDGGE